MDIFVFFSQARAPLFSPEGVRTGAPPRGCIFRVEALILEPNEKAALLACLVLLQDLDRIQKGALEEAQAFADSCSQRPSPRGVVSTALSEEATRTSRVGVHKGIKFREIFLRLIVGGQTKN